MALVANNPLFFPAQHMVNQHPFLALQHLCTTEKRNVCGKVDVRFVGHGKVNSKALGLSALLQCTKSEGCENLPSGWYPNHSRQAQEGPAHWGGVRSTEQVTRGCLVTDGTLQIPALSSTGQATWASLQLQPLFYSLAQLPSLSCSQGWTKCRRINGSE